MGADRRILVLGGSGFIGMNLVEFYKGMPDTAVLNLDVRQPKDGDHMAFWKRADLTDYEGLLGICLSFEPTHVLHMAARTDLDERNDLNGYAVNMDGVDTLIKVLRQCPSLRRVLFTSSMLVCRIGHDPASYDEYLPSTLYGESKMRMELAIKGAGITEYEWAILRPTSIWGPWFDAPYRDFFDMVKSGRFVKISHNTSLRTFGFVGNAVYQIDKLLFAPASDVHTKTFYIGDRTPSIINDWADEVASCMGKTLRSLPFAIFKAAAMTGDVLGLAGIRFPMTSFRLRNMTSSNRIGLLEDTYRVTGNPPYTRKEGTMITVSWMEKNAQK